ncbi:hypothetical protein SAMN05444722_0190 [Rhodovulum sp. ES.010]|uniref:hypothetical protein n=1 Tax=Rhodovulum sp. ES.010 TaxID=1882821 RepID=UPI000928A76D|nr:hypothetical protein [Rhodovulum sp. ES.010]SIO03605.1 hypothetical protein SAMN05444722_0190 [Rhodovulum sp. ES.010]
MTACDRIGPHWRLLAALCVALWPGMAPAENGVAPGASPERPSAVELARRNALALAPRPKRVVDLQVFRAEQTATAADGTRLKLTALNPAANGWFLLDVSWPGAEPEAYHLENPAPRTQGIALTDGPDPAIALTGAQSTQHCRPWAGATPQLATARATGLPFAELCGGRLYLRNRVAGTRTSLERTAEFLRDNVAFGESLVGFVKNTLYKDRYLASGEILGTAEAGRAAEGLGRARLRDDPVMYTTMTFDLVGANPERMEMGAWYAVEGAPGVYASALHPGMIDPAILRAKDGPRTLDGIESRADVYLVGFDLSLFEIGYETGTEHPRLDWSPRPRDRTPGLPGPDGIGAPAPLAPTGLLPPSAARRAAATFTGGFKRSHGAFRFGPRALENHGYHYGFVVHGTVLSRLQPDLATFYVLTDGTVGMKTWAREDDRLLPRIRFARQNGVPLVAPDSATGKGVPGPLVANWLEGNWSGSAEAELRTLRAGACLRPGPNGPFLVYAWFSTATPSAMARVFQAYGCDYAMLLDMNAIEHTYVAVYTPDGEGRIDTRHLVAGMAQIDPPSRDGRRVPRFIGAADNRDFFYLLRKETRE